MGKYNILSKEHKQFTEKILKDNNIENLCYYHYWFCGQKVMNTPAEQLRDSKTGVKYCFSWANETWSSRWDGLEHKILIKQDYGDIEDWKIHINYLLTFFNDDKYIKIDNKPLFFIYRPTNIPKEIFEPMIDFFNMFLIENGFDGLNVILTYNNIGNNIHSCEEKAYISDKIYGIMDFNPNYTNSKHFSKYQENDETYIFKKKSNGKFIYDEEQYLAYNPDIQIAINKGDIVNGKQHYDSTSKEEIQTRLFKSNLADIVKCYNIIEQEPRKHRNQLTSVFMDWNNTPRRDITKQGMKPTVFLNASPQLFKQHLINLIRKIIRDPNDTCNYIIINAWNEWNEQTVLEPSDINGYSYIEAVKTAFEKYY
jgi:hypothetical protein